MTLQVAVVSEGRVTVGRQHLSVSVDVDSGSLGLLEKLFEILHVMTRDENGLAGSGSDGNDGRRLRSVVAVGTVEGVHGDQVLF